MIIHKCVFLINENGVSVYEYKDNEFVVIKHKGSMYYKDGFNENYKDWLTNALDIGEYDLIDFLIISNERINIPNFKNKTKEKSSWNFDTIKSFCDKYIGNINIKIFNDANECIVIQNINRKESGEKVYYYKSIPVLDETTKISKNNFEKNREYENNDKLSLLAQYYREEIKKLTTSQ